eukprot:948042-Amorphochlora_amoeboformis.AAC.1
MESLRLIDDRVNISRSVSRRNSLRSASHITEYYEDDRIVEELSVILQGHLHHEKLSHTFFPSKSRL